MSIPDRLSQCPYMIVRFDCIFCPWRKGRYRLARLAERFGAEATLDHVRDEISPGDCPRRYERANKYVHRCQVWYTDLVSGKPHDVPPPEG